MSCVVLFVLLFLYRVPNLRGWVLIFCLDWMAGVAAHSLVVEVEFEVVVSRLKLRGYLGTRRRYLHLILDGEMWLSWD